MIKEGGIYRHDDDQFSRFAIVIKISKQMIFGVRLAVTQDIISNKQVNDLLLRKLDLYGGNSFWKMKEDKFEENVNGYIGQIREEMLDILQEKLKTSDKYVRK